MASVRPFTWIFILIASPTVAGQSQSATMSSSSSVSAEQATTAARLASAYGTVTSIRRSVARNRAVGGVANSYHLQGRAIDIVRKPGVTHRQLTAALEAAGFTLIESLDEGDHSHFAFGTSPAPSKNASESPTGIDPEVLVGPRSTSTANQAARRLPDQPVLADNHGVLIIDLASNPGRAQAE